MMKTRKQSGYSLVEVLIALAITSVVLLTVVTLFYMGRRNVYSGKQMTYAVSVGTRVLELFSTSGMTDVLSGFGIDDTTPFDTPDPLVNGVTYTNSISRDTDNITATTDPQGWLATWKGWIGQANLANAKGGVILTPRNPTDGTKKWTTAQYLKMRIYIQWDEAQNRRRIAFFDTTKINRQQ
jgi:prepilin-type N-terminal cleavage/methylation domain-containing protein